MGAESRSARPKPVVFRTGFGVPVYAVVAVLLLNLVTSNLLFAAVPVSVPILVASAVILFLMVYLMLSTNYRVRDGVLDVRMGPLGRRIDLESISVVFLRDKDFRGRLYGLGTHLVGIDYEGGSVTITPKDIDGFLAAIGARRTESGDVQAIIRADVAASVFRPSH